MSRKMNKVIAAIVLLSIVLSVVSCGTKEEKSKNTTVSTDTPWYDAEYIDFKIETNSKKHLESLYHYLAGADNDYIAIRSRGSYEVKEWTDDIEYKDWLIEDVTIINRTTKETVKTIDLVSVLRKHDYPINVNYSDGKILVYADTYDPNSGVSTCKEFEIDPITEKVLIARDICNTQEYLQSRSQYSYNVGKNRILPDRISEGKSSYYALRIISPDGTMSEIELKDPMESIYNVPVILALDENTALIPAAMARDYRFYKLDLKTNKLSKANKGDYSWLDVEQLSGFFNSPDGNVYITTSEGISRVDMTNKKYDQILDFSCCGVNRNYTHGLKIADCSEDKILLCGQYTSTNEFKTYAIQDFVIIELTKAAKNPHAGKTIIELYIPEYEMNGIISDAIIRFNETNKKYHILITERYSKDKYMSFDNVKSDDDYVTEDLKASAKLSSELAMDIANGVGPDILMNTSSFGQLNSDNCLVDLSPYFQDLDSDKYYKNIIDGAKNDGKLYQLPVCFTIEGIQTDKNNTGKSGVGFTVEEYKQFLYDTLNGADAIELGQNNYFALLFNNMKDSFIQEGKADLSKPEFAELAQYVKENVKQNSQLWNNEPVDTYELNDSRTVLINKAYHCDCPGISGYLVKRARVQDGTAILGLPSSDGRGPMFGTSISVAVSANAVNKEACIEFIKMLLTDDIQTEFAMNDRFVLNKDALRTGCNEAVAYYNTKEGSEQIMDYSIGTNVTIRIKFTTEDIDNLENVILSCSKADSVDAAINMILIEEMPAYFAGQKTLEQVIPVMQNRIQKVLDERK